MDIIVMKSFIPETFLSISILFQLIFNVKIVNNLKYNFPILDKEIWIQTIFFLFCLFFLFVNLKIEGVFSNFIFINDEGTKFSKILIVLISLFVVSIFWLGVFSQQINFFEFYTVFLISLLSLILLVSCLDLITFYLLIEMQSLCFYILSSIKRNSSYSTEAGLKYFISGAFISGIFLFGCTLIYGSLGTLNLNNINLLLSFSIENDLEHIIKIGAIFITSTLLFKISCAPFHFWTPDVYEGSPQSSTIIFSIIPKVSLFYFFIKWISCLNFFFFNINDIIGLLGLFSTLLGTMYALSQKRLKRLIIYSSISQIGFLVVALSLNTLNGYISLFFFLIVYLITSILIWGNFSTFSLYQYNISTFLSKRLTSLLISSLTNLFHYNKLWSLSFVLIFFSIGGIPPLIGFLSKAYVLIEVINSQNLLSSVILILISSISAYYYIRIIKIIFFEPNKIEKKKENFQIIFYSKKLNVVYLIFSFLLFLLIFLFFSPNILILYSQFIILNGLGL